LLLRQARENALKAITALIRQAAPDLHSADWPAQDAVQLRQLFEQEQQQQQQWDGSAQLHMLQQALHCQLSPAERIAEVQQVQQCVQQHVVLRLEQLVAADYCPRQNWVKETLTPQLQPQPAGDQLQQQQQTNNQQQQHRQILWQPPQQPWGGHTAGATAHAAEQPQNVQQQERLRKHSQQLGASKVEALAAVYALQLQSGAVPWQGMERQLLAPASNLNHFCEYYRCPIQRCMVVSAAGGVIKHAPSLLQWQLSSVGPSSATAAADGSRYGAAAAAAGPGMQLRCMPAEWLLRLWIRTLFDLPYRQFRHAAVQLSWLLAAHPATADLMDQQWLAAVQQQLEAESVASSQLRAALLVRVGCVLGGQGAAGPAKLADLLSGLCQVRVAR
jgi:hypothetical protein